MILAKVPRKILELLRGNIFGWMNGVPQTNLEEWESRLLKVKSAPAVIENLKLYAHTHGGTIPMVPCECLHPSNPFCIPYLISLFQKVFIGIMPVNLSLNIVPLLVFKPLTFLKRYASFSDTALYLRYSK
jgi:hypothetical protein